LVKILFLRSQKAYLPEVDAYVKYFNSKKEFQAYDSSRIKGEYKLDEFDVIWEFKGLGGVNTKEKVLVHEYASLSTGGFPKIKNAVKKWLNPKPDLRIFLNANVKDGFGFNDGIDYCFRDMGIDESFIKLNTKKEYEFVYVGAICKSRGIDNFLKIFTEKDNGKICLVGKVEDCIYNMYKNNRNIIFTGKVPYSEVPRIASKAIYGINYIPDQYPFNIQTSTKLLEYLALGLKIVSTDYKWVRQFEEKHNCSFYKLDCHNLRFDLNEINKYQYTSNFVADNFLWETIIANSKIEEKIKEILKRRNSRGLYN
jgi:glycosyltransferase involved in cell wall biosynthesis